MPKNNTEQLNGEKWDVGYIYYTICFWLTCYVRLCLEEWFFPLKKKKREKKVTALSHWFRWLMHSAVGRVGRSIDWLVRWLISCRVWLDKLVGGCWICWSLPTRLHAHLYRLWSVTHSRLPMWETGPQAPGHVLHFFPQYQYKEERTQHWPQGATLAENHWSAKEDLVQTTTVINTTTLDVWGRSWNDEEEEEERRRRRSWIWLLEWTVWRRTRPRALLQNQHTRELISAPKTSHKHSNIDLSRLR